MAGTQRESGGIGSAGSPVRLHIHGMARGEPGALEQLASELTAIVRSGEPGVLTYRWSRAVDSDAWLIEEEYADSEAFAQHMERMDASGNMRRLGKALRVERVLVVAGDLQAVGKHLGRLPQVVYRGVEELLDELK